MLFEFILRPLEEVQPWGDADKPRLSWFGLTDGWYWWNVGSQQLFRYSQASMDHWVTEYPKLHAASPYEDYQIVRPWEDLINCLPAVIDPVPYDLVQRVQEKESWQRLRSEAFDLALARNDEVIWVALGAAFQWWSDRTWDAGYLKCPPKIWLWTEGDTFHLKWDNRDVVDGGIPVWEATSGEVTMPVAAFIEEVTSFYERLMAAMAERVDAVLSGALRPEITVNMDWLLKEQEDRSTWLQNTLTMRRQNQDWDEVRTAISTIERMCYNNGVEGL